MLLWKVAVLLPWSKDRRSLDISGEKRSYKCFRIESSEVCNFNFFSFASQKSINTHSNGQYYCPFIFGKNERYSKQISDCFEPGNMGLFVEQRDHKYCRIPPRVTQCGSRYSVEDSKGCKRVEVKSQDISEDLQIDLFASRMSHQLPTYISWKLDPYSQGRDAFQISWINKKRYAFAPFCLIDRVLEKTQSDQATLIVVTPGWKTQSWYPLLNVNKESLATSKYSRSFDRTKQTKSSVDILLDIRY